VPLTIGKAAGQASAKDCVYDDRTWGVVALHNASRGEHGMHREIGVGSKTAVFAVVLAGLASTGQACAQNASVSSAKASDSQTSSPSSIHQPLNLKLAPQAATSDAGTWKDERTLATQPNPFAGMFQKQAQNGDPRRVPMYLLMPFARVTPSTTNPTFAPQAANPNDQPNVVKDVGALVRTLQAGG
jgi:secreted trypsin-like serine protease